MATPITGVGQRVPVGNVVVRGHAAQGDMKVVARCVIASSVRDVLAALRSDLVEKRFFTAGHRMDNTSVPTTTTSHAEPPVSERSTRKVLVGRQPVPAQGMAIYTAEHSSSYDGDSHATYEVRTFLSVSGAASFDAIVETRLDITTITDRTCSMITRIRPAIVKADGDVPMRVVRAKTMSDAIKAYRHDLPAVLRDTFGINSYPLP
ncbi:Uncharacterized protein PBTT_10151 [Plasmodiophora brassicae]|uniref:Uncharacterized protein n=1 Tax=Plasmodiophora brassicae TaxID=37360 RepID=A0A0G4INY9_PLABS|nr:hypothetical protein PBRA_005488 [Plasmodiophora brassicae]SPR01841.1 unnamed protein product [Plasmodiophora brassicae]